MLKYKSGEEVRVGDEIESPGPYWRRAVVTALERASRRLTATWDSKAVGQDGALIPGQWNLVSRATPAPDAREVIGKDREGRPVRAGDTLQDTELPQRKIVVEEFRSGLFYGHPVTCARNKHDGECTDGISGAFVILVTDSAPTQDTTPAPPPVAEEPSGRAVAIINEQAERAFPKPFTHKLCPACGERQSGAECMQPACVQVRRCVAAREAEDLTRRGYERFDAIARDAAEHTRIRVVTDIVGGDRFMAEFSVDGLKKTIVKGLYVEKAALIGDCKLVVVRLQEELGSRALRGGGR